MFQEAAIIVVTNLYHIAVSKFRRMYKVSLAVYHYLAVQQQ